MDLKSARELSDLEAVYYRAAGNVQPNSETKLKPEELKARFGTVMKRANKILHEFGNENRSMIHTGIFVIENDEASTIPMLGISLSGEYRPSRRGKELRGFSVTWYHGNAHGISGGTPRLNILGVGQEGFEKIASEDIGKGTMRELVVSEEGVEEFHKRLTLVEESITILGQVDNNTLQYFAH